MVMGLYRGSMNGEVGRRCFMAFSVYTFCCCQSSIILLSCFERPTQFLHARILKYIFI